MTRSVMDRCTSRTALWLLLHLLLTASAAPQFTNLRVLKSGNVQGRSSAVKRVSMIQLLQRLEQSQLAKNLIGGSAAPVKESVIKRVAMINSPATFKPLFTRFAALNKTLPTTSRYVPDQLTDTPTTQATPTTSAPPTRATPTKRATLKSKFYVKKTASRPSAATKPTTTQAPPTKATTAAPPASAPPTKSKAAPVKLKNGDLLVSKSELKNLPNSPIYYIKLPHSGYSFVGGSAAKASGLSSAFPHVQLPIDFSSNGKPSAIYLANKRPATTTATTTSTTSATTRAEDEASSTTAKTPLTESRVIYIKGNFNGKPNHVYWEKAHYRPPTYWDFLHHLYPKLRKAQLIR